ncbi:hypothetical protein EDB85DRAFT_2179674, partial [Lactarius pseudohatsudake]
LYVPHRGTRCAVVVRVLQSVALVRWSAQTTSVVTLEHPDRVRRINIIIPSSEMFEVVAAMQVPFPVLTLLELTGPEEDRLKDMLCLPGDILGGSAPCPSVGLEKLRLSAHDLVSLQRENIPLFGYISPEEIVGGLAGLTRLRTPSIRFTIP